MSRASHVIHACLPCLSASFKTCSLRRDMVSNASLKVKNSATSSSFIPIAKSTACRALITQITGIVVPRLVHIVSTGGSMWHACTFAASRPPTPGYQPCPYIQQPCALCLVIVQLLRNKAFRDGRSSLNSWHLLLT